MEYIFKTMLICQIASQTIRNVFLVADINKTNLKSVEGKIFKERELFFNTSLRALVAQISTSCFPYEAVIFKYYFC